MFYMLCLKLRDSPFVLLVVTEVEGLSVCSTCCH